MSETTESCTLFRDDYRDKFPPLAYLQSYWNLEEPWVQFHIDNGFRLLRRESVQGTRLLDLGSGPNLLNVIAAPDNFTHIVMADYAENNLDFLRQWSRGEHSAFDWQRVCQYYKQKHNLGQDWENTRLSKLKSCLKDIVKCDVIEPEPLGSTYTGFFDCVVTSFCLEVGSRDADGYIKSVRNVASLLRPGGHLVMRGACGESCYPVAGRTFHTLNLTPQLIVQAMETADFDIVEFTVEGCSEDPYQFKVTTNTGFCLLARKSTS